MKFKKRVPRKLERNWKQIALNLRRGLIVRLALIGTFGVAGSFYSTQQFESPNYLFAAINLLIWFFVLFHDDFLEQKQELESGDREIDSRREKEETDQGT